MSVILHTVFFFWFLSVSLCKLSSAFIVTLKQQNNHKLFVVTNRIGKHCYTVMPKHFCHFMIWKELVFSRATLNFDYFVLSEFSKFTINYNCRLVFYTVTFKVKVRIAFGHLLQKYWQDDHETKIFILTLVKGR